MTTPLKRTHALALDIGGSHVTAARIDLIERTLVPGSLMRREVAHTAGAQTLLDAWAKTALEATRTSPLPVSHIGVAMPGPFDYAAGVSLLQHKFAALYRQNVGQGLMSMWAHSPLQKLDMTFRNDAGAWALGEWWGGAARGFDRVIGITLGTGFGSGFVAGGEIVTGGDLVPHGGELWDSPYLDSIAEAYVAGRAIVSGFQQLTGEQSTAREIERAASAGDAHARAVFQGIGHHLGEILSPWVSRFKPECLVVGGNISRAWQHLSPPLIAALPEVKCLPTTHFEDSSLLGSVVP